jgi:RNA polymerase sigma factor (sigma-70 family)
MHYVFHCLSDAYIPFQNQQDMAQDILVGVWRRIGSVTIENEKQLFGYLNKSARNARIDYFRSKYAATQSVDDEGFHEPRNPQSDHSYVIEQKDTVQAILENLPLIYRQVVELRLLQGLSEEETGVALGISTSLVSTRLTRAKLRMKDIHKKLFPEITL